MYRDGQVREVAGSMMYKYYPHRGIWKYGKLPLTFLSSILLDRRMPFSVLKVIIFLCMVLVRMDCGTPVFKMGIMRLTGATLFGRKMHYGIWWRSSVISKLVPWTKINVWFQKFLVQRLQTISFLYLVSFLAKFQFCLL